MSTVVMVRHRGGIVVSADCREMWGNLISNDGFRKVTQIGDRLIVAGVGTSADVRWATEWWRAYEDKAMSEVVDDFGDAYRKRCRDIGQWVAHDDGSSGQSQFLVVGPVWQCHVVNDGEAHEIDGSRRFFALGSGMEFALGALEAVGRDVDWWRDDGEVRAVGFAELAVKVAARFDAGTGGGIWTERLSYGG